MTRDEHLDATRTPKRILALDGGGIRGILTLEYLAVIEDKLRRRTGRADLVLSDYFDLIGGTSTGSIIAAALACGRSVKDLQEIYRQLGKSLFRSSIFRKGYLAPKFPTGPVRKALDAELGAETTLNSTSIRTGLMIMAKRLDTGSPWPLHNNPNAAFASSDGKLLLTQVVRASTAAPTYFEPERIKIQSGVDGQKKPTMVDAAFVDGGVSPYNDPSLQLLMLATLQGHGFRWQTGADKILLISVGTGTYKQTSTTADLMKMPAAKQGIQALQSLMDDCARMNHATVQWLTDCKTPWIIDLAVGDMREDSAKGPKLATSARYDVLLKPDWLQTNVAIALEPKKIVKIAQMDDPTNMEELADIGKKAAAVQIKDDHFPKVFDVS